MSRRLAHISPQPKLRLTNGDVVSAIAVGYDDDHNSSAFLAAYDEAAQGAPFWVDEDDVVEHWLEPTAVTPKSSGSEPRASAVGPAPQLQTEVAKAIAHGW